jgi:hypothetical protein
MKLYVTQVCYEHYTRTYFKENTMKLYLRTLLSTTALVFVSSSAFAQSGDLTHVTLSDAGLAQYSRAVSVENGDAEVSIKAKLSEMDDILKSLVVVGENIKTAHISVGSSRALEDVFETLPFEPSDLSYPERLISKLPGSRIKVTNSERGGLDSLSIEGRVLGVAQEVDCGKESICPPVVSLMSDTGVIERVFLWEGVKIQVLDETLQSSIMRGMDALMEHGIKGIKTVKVHLNSSESSGTVLVSTVLPAPIWKPAYKAVVSNNRNVDLQAWAVVENASGEDWKDIMLTLSSGSPQTLSADLYNRSYGHRERNSDRHDMQMKSTQLFSASSRNSEGFSSDSVSEEMPMMAMAPLQTGTSNSEGTTGATFSFDTPVSIKAGEVASVPFLTGDLDVKIASYYQPRGYSTEFESPDRVLDFKNSLPVRLPSGITTLYDEDEGFLGDVQMPELHPEEQSVLKFGTETRLKVKESQSFRNIDQKLTILDGILRVEVREIIETTYDIRGSSNSDVPFILDIPIDSDYSFDVSSGESFSEEMLNRSLDVRRFEFVLKTDENKKIITSQTRPLFNSYSISDLSNDDIIAYASKSLDDKTKMFLLEAVRLRNLQQSSADALKEIEETENELISSQERFARLLDSLEPGSGPYTKFSDELLNAQDKLEALVSSKDSAEKELNKIKEQFRNHLQTF